MIFFQLSIKASYIIKVCETWDFAGNRTTFTSKSYRQWIFLNNINMFIFILNMNLKFRNAFVLKIIYP
jgi:hypothetical protein